MFVKFLIYCHQIQSSKLFNAHKGGVYLKINCLGKHFVIMILFFFNIKIGHSNLSSPTADIVTSDDAF